MASVLRAKRERGVGGESAREGTIPSRSISKSFPLTSLLLLSTVVRGKECVASGVCEGVRMILTDIE